ncbi:MAG: phosphoribosyltransferase [Blautia sp.]|nr:phosphoribosyltransferase [Blautia sp.]
MFSYTHVQNGSDFLIRIKDMKAIRSGAAYTVDEIKESITVGSDVFGKTIILLDDIVNSGNTAKA